MRLGYYYPISQIRKLRSRTFTLSKIIQLDNAGTKTQTSVFLVSEHGSMDSRLRLPQFRSLLSHLPRSVSSLNLLICKTGVMMMMIPTTLGMVVGIQQVLNKS